MDPMNNPTPTPNPTPEGSPMPDGGAPAGSDMAAVGGAAPEGMNNSMPVDAVPGAPNPEPVNPIINPTGGVMSPVGMPATEPIMEPEPKPEPDPIEEELNAPMKAADPVPGSIGSAVSGPANGGAPAPEAAAPGANPFATAPAGQTPNVSFTDPATQPDVNGNMNGQPAPAKKKASKNTLIALIIVAAMVVIALVAVLVIMLNSGNGNNNVSNQPANNTVKVDEPEEVITSLVCTIEGQVRDAAANNATNGTADTSGTASTTGDVITEPTEEAAGLGETTKVTATFVDDELTEVVTDVTTTNTTGDKTTATSKLTATEFLSQINTGKGALSAEGFEVGDDGTIVVTLENLTAAYEEIDYTCDVL